ncbi:MULTISPECIES: hypothetical protein [unclassified Lentimonas]|uniref:hypothetical protein n=1 Tax=unclassified Lentimonas TaxID=2630993 RepID=UPI0013276D3D|nr:MULTISPECIES: hypothetical protein [unclassified Lentimonas]CAA6676638.1 Unannotated [Lentimonas sp. CC4]CAA6684699.1 Unannotated [Lentimonas sp. CC6]CAA7075334.1 Unannotated [Lentimonas sp. CC4]CAA7170977.1 Unannotated [Lentimonas sp. CC21]CAA7182257.1 Unannotated [Lentimonas sp. CC8]
MNDTNTLDFIDCPTCFKSVQMDMLIPAGGTHVCANCREAYLQRMKEGVHTAQSGECAAIRQEHIKHEASIRSVGLLYYFGGFLVMMGGLSASVTSFGASGGEGSAAFIGIFSVVLILGVGLISVGRGFRRLRPWVKIPATILSALGLLNIPIGTLIHGYILYLIHSQKGKVVFSPEYQEIREATPEIKYKTSKLVWAILIVLLLGLVALVGFALMG